MKDDIMEPNLNNMKEQSKFSPVPLTKIDGWVIVGVVVLVVAVFAELVYRGKAGHHIDEDISQIAMVSIRGSFALYFGILAILKWYESKKYYQNKMTLTGSIAIVVAILFCITVARSLL